MSDVYSILQDSCQRAVAFPEPDDLTGSDLTTVKLYRFVTLLATSELMIQRPELSVQIGKLVGLNMADTNRQPYEHA